jgi:hypothetical protein
MFDRKDSKELRECRDAFFGAPIERRKEEIPFNGKKYTVREPTIGEYDYVMERSGMKLSDLRNMDMAVATRASVYAAFKCTITPDGHALFEDSDLPALLEFPAGCQAADLLRRLGNAAIKMMNEKAEAQSKKSEPTPSDSIASDSPAPSAAPSQS